MVLDNIFSGKIRVALLTKLLLNPASKVYLRGLERDLGVSSNTVRLELNKLQEMHLIEAQDDSENTKVKNYVVNQGHPMFKTLRGIIMQFEGKNSPFVDLVIVGNVDKNYMYQLIEKVEPLIQKKVRVASFSKEEFNNNMLTDIGATLSLFKI